MIPSTGRDRRPSATLEEVARAAGVSRATVSRVVNDSPKVSAEMRTSVQTAIDRLGYVPNRAARSLVTRRSDSVGLVITEPTGRLFSDPFFPRLVRGISAGLVSQDLQLLLLMPDSITAERRMIGYLSAGHVDGVLLVSLHGEDPLPDRLREHGMPVVVMGRPPHDAAVSYVDVDNRQGARSAVAHLVAGGRKTIATIAGPADMAVGIDRLDGYRDAVIDAGLRPDPTLEAVADFTQEGGAQAMTRLLKDRPDLDAVFAASDLMAAGAMNVLQTAGRQIPRDVAVVGFDDSPVARTTTPPLTSVRQPIEEMGREMARLLIDAINGTAEAPRRTVLSTELIRRASTRGERAR